MEPRGIRNNNPGNVRKSQTAWKGLAPVQSDPEFFICETMAFGVRMTAMILLHYYRVLGLKTVRKIISRWAPPSENNTDAYIAAVCATMGLKPDDELDLDEDASELDPLCDAIFIHENGQAVSPHDVLQGVLMALQAV